MSDTLIKVEHLSKKFCRSLKRSLWYGALDIGSELLGRQSSGELRKNEFWAVDDVSFELKRGECLGLIGHNGAGKSTLLKMLNGLIKPDRGSITMKGRVGALIELGTGFNPILTGRENIYNNGAVLGFSRAEIDRKFDDIVEFSEIGDFIDTPVQNYSSGMKVRLGFSVAAQMEPDVLLIDEVLAVGDISFVLKCFNRMDKLLQNTAIILVSHSIPQIARMCTSLVVMKSGKPIYHNQDVSEGINLYYSMLSKPIGNYLGTDAATLGNITLSSGDRVAEPGKEFLIPYKSSLTITIEVSFHRPITNPSLYLAFYDKEQRNFCEVLNFKESVTEISTEKQHYTFQAHIPSIEFAQGVYSITIGLADLSNANRENIFRMQSAVYFQVTGKHHGWAPLQLQPEWKVLG